MSEPCGCEEEDTYCEIGERLRKESDRTGNVWANEKTNESWVTHMYAWNAWLDHLEEAIDASND